MIKLQVMIIVGNKLEPIMFLLGWIRGEGRSFWRRPWKVGSFLIKGKRGRRILGIRWSWC